MNEITTIINLVTFGLVIAAVRENIRFRNNINKSTEELREVRDIAFSYILRQIIKESIEGEDYEMAKKAQELLDSITSQDGIITISKTNINT